MIRLIYYALLAYLIYSLVLFFRNLGRRGRAASSGPRSAPVSGRMVKDEACQTYLPVENALRDVIDGREYYFCSQECRQKFRDRMKSNAP